MAMNSGFFQQLNRHYLNHRLTEVSRGDDVLFGTPLSSQWLKLQDDLLIEPMRWEKAQQWQSILHGITRTAGIIYGSRQYQILYDAEYNENYLYSAKPSIVVSTEPVKRPLPGFTLYDAVDTMTGQVIHEAAHLHERQTDEDGFKDDEIMSLLYHLVEDVIIDTIIATQYPGFEDYLLKYRRYLIDHKLRKSWGIQIEGRMKQLIMAVRSTLPIRINRQSVHRAYLYLLYLLSKHRTVNELRRISRIEIAEQVYAILYDAKHADHWREEDVLSESFVLGKVGPSVKGKKGNNLGGLELKPVTRASLHRMDPSEMDWLEDQVKPNQKDKTKPKKLFLVNTFTHRSVEEFRHDRIPPQKYQAISLEETRMIRKQEEEKQVPRKGVDEKYDYQVHLSLRPLYYKAAERYSSAVHAVRGQITRLRNDLAWTNSSINQNQFGLVTGELDEDALYRAKYARDLFMKPIPMITRSRKLDVVLIIDASHSMKETMPGSDVSKSTAAQRLTALFVESLERVDSIHTWAFSFTGSGKAVNIYELYSPEAKADKARIGDIFPKDQTPEYEALLAISAHIEQTSRFGVQKVYIILSDGCPEDDMIPQDMQMKEIKKLVKRLHVQGDIVIHVALGPEVTTSKIYPHRIEFPAEGYSELVRRFGNRLRKLVMLEN